MPGSNNVTSPRQPIFDPAPTSATRKFVLPVTVVGGGGLNELPPFSYAGQVLSLATSPGYPVRTACNVVEIAIVVGSVGAGGATSFDVLVNGVTAYSTTAGSYGLTLNAVSIGLVAGDLVAIKITATPASPISNLTVVLRIG